MMKGKRNTEGAKTVLNTPLCIPHPVPVATVLLGLCFYAKTRK